MITTMPWTRAHSGPLVRDDAHALFVARVLLRATRAYRCNDRVAAARTLQYLFRECTECSPRTLSRFCAWLDGLPTADAAVARAVVSGAS